MPFGVTLRKAGSVRLGSVKSVQVDGAAAPPAPPPDTTIADQHQNAKPPPSSAKAGQRLAALEAAARGGSTRAMARLATLEASEDVPPTKPRRPSEARASADLEIKPAWSTFLSASEVPEVVGAYAALRSACAVPNDACGRLAFDGVLQATLVAEGVPHRTRSLVQALAELWKLRPSTDGGMRLVISGAGPVGLRAAVEAALMGMHVLVIERREVFSRVNVRHRPSSLLSPRLRLALCLFGRDSRAVRFTRGSQILMLWQQTADDLVALGARTFYPKFSNRQMGTSPLHLGTREIQ